VSRPEAVDAAVFLAEIGQRVARLREDRGWTQVELGARAGVPASAIGTVERGRGSVDVVRLWRITRGLGVPMVDVLPDAGLVRPVRGPLT